MRSCTGFHGALLQMGSANPCHMTDSPYFSVFLQSENCSKNDRPMYYIKKRMEIAGCHSLRLSYESKCSRLHGHNWVVTVYCRATELNGDGMVADFTHIKEHVHGRLDHGNFNELFPFNPTAENIARWICGEIEGCFMVSVQESEGNSVLYVSDDATAADIAAGSAI